MYHGEKLVFALFEVLCDVEFRGVVRALAVADEFAVYIEVNAGHDAEESYDIAAGGAVDFKILPIYGDRLLIGNVGGLVVKSIGAVDVSGAVVAGPLPGRRDGYFVEFE